MIMLPITIDTSIRRSPVPYISGFKNNLIVSSASIANIICFIVVSASDMSRGINVQTATVFRTMTRTLERVSDLSLASSLHTIITEFTYIRGITVINIAFS